MDLSMLHKAYIKDLLCEKVGSLGLFEMQFGKEGYFGPVRDEG